MKQAQQDFIQKHGIMKRVISAIKHQIKASKIDKNFKGLSQKIDC